MLSSTQVEKLNSQEREQLYTSLADIYIQLRRLEFPSIGRLEQTQSSHGFQVGQKAATIDINMQQLEGLDPFAVQDAHSDDRGCMQSATAYANMLLDIGYNAFFKSRNAVEIGMGRDAVYHHYLFYQHAKQWIDPALDNGPFVLVHGDLHPSNLMVNDKMRIIGVLDWEWSRVVPVQFFVPPLWISGRTTVQLAGHNTWQLFLITSFKEFLSVTESRELYMFGNTLLSREWAERSTRAEPLVANALENWTDMDWFAYRYLSRGDKEAAKESIKTFIDEDPLRRLVAEMKERDASAYHKEFAKVMDTGIRPGKQPLLLIFLGQLSRVLHAGPNTAIIACVGVPIVLSLIWRPSSVLIPVSVSRSVCSSASFSIARSSASNSSCSWSDDSSAISRHLPSFCNVVVVASPDDADASVHHQSHLPGTLSCPPGLPALVSNLVQSCRPFSWRLSSCGLS